VTSTAQQVNEHLLRDCAALYTQLIEKEVAGKLPVESEDELKEMHERCEKPAHQLLKQRAMVVDIDSDLAKKLYVSLTQWRSHCVSWVSEHPKNLSRVSDTQKS